MNSPDTLPDRIRPFFTAGFYPHPAHDIEMIETHISWVFLTGDYAYKLKKPVDLGFLDFSTLARRRFYCEQELRLNRRLAPSLYLQVVPVCRTEDGFSLGGAGTIVDYCLKMRQFAQHELMERQLAAGHFDPAWMDSLACDVARFHAQAEAGAAARTYGDPSILADHIRANLAVARRHIGEAIDAASLSRLERFAETEFARCEPLLVRRRLEGHIRDCHGDLHLRNITLHEGRPCIFDCIEFNDEYRMIDTMNDAAFLVMDCDARERSDLGMRFLSRYLEFSGDYDGLALLRLYLFYRACVRGKVACLLAEGGSLPAGELAAQYAEARHYFELAASYAEARPIQLFAVGGLSASGKSHLALKGCGPAHAIIIRSDATRKRLAPALPGLPLYGREMGMRTYAAMVAAAEQLLKAGWSVILDATFLHAESRDQIRQLAERCSVPLHMVWLDLPEAELKRRILQRSRDDTDISDADLAVLEGQLAGYRRPAETDIEFQTDSERWPF